MNGAQAAVGDVVAIRPNASCARCRKPRRPLAPRYAFPAMWASSKLTDGVRAQFGRIGEFGALKDNAS